MNARQTFNNDTSFVNTASSKEIWLSLMEYSYIADVYANTRLVCLGNTAPSIQPLNGRVPLSGIFNKHDFFHLPDPLTQGGHLFEFRIAGRRGIYFSKRRIFSPWSGLVGVLSLVRLFHLQS